MAQRSLGQMVMQLYPTAIALHPTLLQQLLLGIFGYVKASVLDVKLIKYTTLIRG